MARCWGFQIVSEAILRVFRSEGGSGAGPGPTFRAVAAVGGRCGPQARLVEDEGEEGNFTRGMGGFDGLWRNWSMLGAVGISGRIVDISGDLRDLLTGGGGEGLGKKSYFYWQRKLPDPH